LRGVRAAVFFYVRVFAYVVLSAQVVRTDRRRDVRLRDRLKVAVRAFKDPESLEDRRLWRAPLEGVHETPSEFFQGDGRQIARGPRDPVVVKHGTGWSKPNRLPRAPGIDA
jgi:hypothetical protein